MVSPNRQSVWLRSAAVLCALLIVHTVHAAQVSIDVSSRNVYANIEFSLIIQITNANTFEMPVLPAMNGIDVVGDPVSSESTRITTINGQMTQRRDVSLRYQLLVRDEGKYTIPPIGVTADKQRFESAPITVVATSPAAGEELRAEILAPDSIYVGQPIHLTLRIWIKPFASEEFGVRTSSTDMWALIQTADSDWGPFETVAAQYNSRDPRRRLPPVREVTETTDDGSLQSYYLYELNATQWPSSAGMLAFDPVQILVAYPTRLERRRDMFRRDDITIAEWQPMLRSLNGPRVDVLAPPSQAQPDVFAGAVGEFGFSVRAEPQNVAVGDPITLTMNITDNTHGDVQLELLQPSPLNRVAELTSSFRMPAEPLTGVVRGNVKTFRQTIRATSSDITDIPPIPFAYFDPQQKRYIVLRSDSIPINVQSTRSVGVGDVEGAELTPEAESTQLTQLEGGILANTTGTDALLRDQRFRFRWHHWLILLLPPALYCVVGVSRIRAQKLRSDTAGRRARLAKRNAMQRLHKAFRAPSAEQADLVTAALQGYVADRIDAQARAMVRTDVIARLHDWDIPDAVIRDVEKLLLECDALRYGSSANGDTAALVDRAQNCIEALERQNG